MDQVGCHIWKYADLRGFSIEKDIAREDGCIHHNIQGQLMHRNLMREDLGLASKSGSITDYSHPDIYMY
jgi:hypothetical protein